MVPLWLTHLSPIKDLQISGSLAPLDFRAHSLVSPAPHIGLSLGQQQALELTSTRHMLLHRRGSGSVPVFDQTQPARMQDAFEMSVLNPFYQMEWNYP